MQPGKGPQARPYTFSLSSGMIVFLVFPWINSFLRPWGYVPYRGAGIGLGLGILAVIVLLVLAMDYGLYRLEVDAAARAGIWLAAALGPLAGFAALEAWGSPIGGQVMDIAMSLLAFTLGYSAARRQRLSF